MKILNLYAGIGGNRKLWGDEHEVTAVEIIEELAGEYKASFPKDNVIISDAHEYLRNHYQEFDFIWSSPPCPTHSRLCNSKQIKQFPSMVLYQEVIFLKHFFKGYWVVENVIPYYEPLIKPSVIMSRHCFWSNFDIKPMELKHINIASCTNKELSEDLNIVIPNCNNKTKALRNCVNPKLALHILNEYLQERSKERV